MVRNLLRVLPPVSDCLSFVAAGARGQTARGLFSTCPPNRSAWPRGPGGEFVLAARGEALEQRGGEHRRGHALVDRRPAPSSAPRRSPRRGRRICSSSGSFASACGVRSSSHEPTTLPRRQTSAISATAGRTGSAPARASAPSRRRAPAPRRRRRRARGCSAPRRTRPSSRTRSRCGPSSRSAPRRPGRSAGSPARRSRLALAPGRARGARRPRAPARRRTGPGARPPCRRRRSSGSSRARARRRRRSCRMST